MQRYKILVEYKGSGYQGWVSGSSNSVQAVLERACSQLVNGGSVQWVGSGRTDAGVHALGQVAHVDVIRKSRRGLGVPLASHALLRAINHSLRQEQHTIRVMKACMVPNTFHARHSALERTYVYRLLHVHQPPTASSLAVSSVLDSRRLAVNHHPRHAEAPSSLATHYRPSAMDDLRAPLLGYHDNHWLVSRPLDVQRMLKAGQRFVGEHDFRHFCKRDPERSPRRSIGDITVSAQPAWASPFSGDVRLTSIDVRLRAPSFLYNQVRYIVGAMAQVASGERDISDIDQCLLSDTVADSSAKRFLCAPAHGLFLAEVKYPPPFDAWTDQPSH